jgi:hypothetical protein
MAPSKLLLLLVLAPVVHAILEELPSDARARANAALAAAKNAPPSSSSGCGTRPLVIVYGSRPPTDLGPLIEDQPPLPRLPPIATGADVELHQASSSSCLSSVKRIRGTLLIFDDGGLGDSSLGQVLSNLQQVAESLIVYGTGSSSLTSLSGLGSLESVGNLALARLPKLSSVAGLERLRTVNGGFVVWRTPELQSLDAMGPIQVVQERVWIENAPKLLSLGRLPPLPPPPPSPPLGAALPTTTARITRASENGGDGAATGLSALRSVGLDLHIENCDVPSLELPFLASTGGEIALLNNRRLASTQGLRALTSTLGVALIGNALLADVDGFSRLTELKGDLSVVNNAAIQTLNGFANLRGIGMSVDVSSNPALRSLDGMRALQGVGQMLNIGFNPSLEALRGFGALRSVGADLIVRQNEKLKELTDLGASLQIVGAGPAGGALIVEDNEALTSLAPLGSPPLQVVRGEVRVRAGNGFGAGGPNAGVGAGGGGGDSGAAALEALAQPNFAFYSPAPAGGTTTAMVPAAPTTTPTTTAMPVAPQTPVPASRVATAVPAPGGGAALTTTTTTATPRAVVAPTPMAAGPGAAPAAPAGPSAFVNTLG